MASRILKANTHIKRKAKWRENYLYGVTATALPMHDPRPFVSEHLGRFIQQTELRVINTSSCKLLNGSLFAHKIHPKQYVPSP